MKTNRLKHQLIDVGQVTLHTVEMGSGEPIIFLHGFPEFWYGWHKQMPFFSEQGYHVIVPDQRGYNLSDKPLAIADYHLNLLCEDVLGLINHFGYEQVTLVAHDWGAAVAWWMALKHPQRLKKLVILNSPHPHAFRQHLQQSAWQQLKSSYMLAFQMPFLPEWLISRNHWQLGIHALKTTSRPRAFTDEDWALYRTAWSRPNAMRAMFNWYRAIAQTPQDSNITTYTVTVPTLIIWGKQDPFFDWELAQKSIDMCQNGRLVYLEHATHWLQHEEPERINHLVLEFIRDNQTLYTNGSPAKPPI